MAEEAENIGGISVSVGASHAQLQADLAQANRILDQWAKQVINVRIGAQVQQPTQQQAARAAPPPAVAVGPGVATRVQAAQAQTAIQRAINTELAKTGERYNAQTGEIEKATAAAQKQRTVITQSATQINQVSEQVKPISLEVDTAGLRAELDAVLAKFREITEEARKLATIPTAPKAAAIPRTVAAKPVVAAPSSGAAATLARDTELAQARERVARANRFLGFTPLPRKARVGAQTIRSFEGDEEEGGIPPQRLDPRPRIINTNLGRTPRVVITTAQKQAEKNAIRTAAAEQKRDRDRTLQELSYEAQREGPGGPTSRTLIGGARRTPAEIEALRQQEAQRANAIVARPRQPVPVAAITPQATPIDAIERQRRQLLASIEAGQGRGGVAATAGIRGIGEEDIARRTEQRIASAESSRIAAGRTARTTAAGFGGQFLFGGPARQQVEAVARQSEAEQNLARIRRLANDPRIIRDARAYRQVIEEQTVAENTLAKATEKVQSFTGGGTALRSLAAVTVAGAAFGLALKAVDVGIAAVSTGLGPLIERSLNYADVASNLTGTLSDQVRANNNNVILTTRVAAAQAGLSQAAQQTVTPLIAQRTETEAGNKAFANLIDNLKAYQAIRKQNANLPPGVDAQLFRDVTGVSGTGIGGVASTIELLKNQINELPSAATREGVGGRGATGPLPFPAEQVANNAALIADNLKVFNDQLVAVGDTQQKFVASSTEGVDALKKSLLPGAKELGAALAAKNIGVTGVSTNQDIIRLIQSLTKSVIQPAAQLQEQFNVQRFATINAAARQQQFSLATQIPAQAGLQALANPLQPVGTGLVAANAREQAKITEGERESVTLQKQLNDYYAQGKQILIDTYQVPQQLIADVENTGKAIAAAQAGISNEQAAYQVAQYNFQLLIAKRTLSDIGGLTGKNFGAGESYLGTLERQNLALSRQGQQLQFNLSQRQINFQVALAGFQAPGVTPEERQARIAEAKTEASYAQKQLDIQRQMFGNQVKIVDISNLRQGADLAKQIGLLLQGRQVTIDTHIAEEKLLRLQALQQKQVQQVGTYLTKVDSLTAAAFSEIQQLEVAAGHAMANVAQQVLAQYGIVIKGITDFATGGGTTKTHAGGGTLKPTAAGGIFQTQGPTMFGNRVVGEAAGETVAILSHPRAMTNTDGGGGSVTVNFNGDMVIRSDNDIDEITRKVTKALGREASVKGLRGIN